MPGHKTSVPSLQSYTYLPGGKSHWNRGAYFWVDRHSTGTCRMKDISCQLCRWPSTVKFCFTVYSATFLNSITQPDIFKKYMDWSPVLDPPEVMSEPSRDLSSLASHHHQVCEGSAGVSRGCPTWWGKSGCRYKSVWQVSMGQYQWQFGTEKSFNPDNFLKNEEHHWLDAITVNSSSFGVFWCLSLLVFWCLSPLPPIPSPSLPATNLAPHPSAWLQLQSPTPSVTR